MKATQMNIEVDMFPHSSTTTSLWFLITKNYTSYAMYKTTQHMPCTKLHSICHVPACTHYHMPCTDYLDKRANIRKQCNRKVINIASLNYVTVLMLHHNPVS